MLALSIAGAGLPAANDAVSSPVPGASLAEAGQTTMPLEAASVAVPKWRGGALITVDRSRPSLPVTYVFDREGRTISRVPFSIPEASVRIHAFTRAPDGTLAVVGLAHTADHRGTSFLAIVSPDGQRQRLIKLNPFSPEEVAITSDGAYWVAGYEIVDGRFVNPHHGALRRYSLSGGELGAYVPPGHSLISP